MEATTENINILLKELKLKTDSIPIGLLPNSDWEAWNSTVIALRANLLTQLESRSDNFNTDVSSVAHLASYADLQASLQNLQTKIRNQT